MILTNRQDINPEDSFNKVKRLTDSIPHGHNKVGILRKVNLMNPPTTMEEHIRQLLENLEIMPK